MELPSFDAAQSVPADTMLAELARRPVAPTRRVLDMCLTSKVYAESEVHPPPVSGAPVPPYRHAAPRTSLVERRFTTDAQRAAALGLGLVRLGACFEALLGKRFDKEVWATHDGAAHVHLRIESEGQERYFIASYFDDGGVILTWSRAAPITPSQLPEVISCGGTGDLAADFASHLEAVRGELERGRRYVRVETIEVAAQLTTHYYRQLIALSSAHAMLSPVYGAGAIGALLAILSWLFLAL